MYLQADKIPPPIVRAITNENDLGIPAISLWEIAMLSSKGRIILPEDLLIWLQKALSQPKIKLLPLTPEIAVRSVLLPVHGDPADRLIAATALEHNCRLATADRLLCQFPLLKTVG
jgi:PIN domain nuclease of toxin-antitoxin system